MPKTIIAEGKTSTEAIEKGLRELKVSKNQVDIKIIEEKKKSFFNILDPHMVKVELTLREEKIKKENKKIEKEIVRKEAKPEDLSKAKENIEHFLKQFLATISEEINYNVKIEDGIIWVSISGEESARLIGYRGEALGALQTILTVIASKGEDTNVKTILDIGNYKETRKKTLEELSDKIEKTVIRTGKSVTLEPMSAYERKIIHSRLQRSKYVKTYSIGENDRRRVVIAKK